MEEPWFTVVSDTNESTPLWMTEAIKDKDYVVIRKDEYFITCEILERRIQQQRDKIKALEILSLMNSNEFGRQMLEKEKVIKLLERKINQIKDNNKKSHNILKELQNQYNDLKFRCDNILEVVSCLRSNVEENIE